MARGQGIKHYYNFTRGWNTEASPMTFPEGTARDLDNVIIDIDGSIRRRGGINFDVTGTSFANTSSTSLFGINAIASFEWLNVAGQGSLAFTVTQFGTTLYFHRQAGTDTVSNPVGSVDFSSFALDTIEASKNVVSVDNGLGYLFVVGKYIEPFYIEYDVELMTLTATQIDIKIRDFDGLDDGLGISERPTTLSDEHYYNLLNQGWVDEGYAMSLENRGSSTINVVTIGNPIQATFDEEQLGFYPSNADIMYLAKTSVGDSPDVIGAYRPFILENLALGNTPAPKGHFILDAFNKQRGTESGVNVPAEILNNRPNAIAFHNGRVFFSGLTATGHTGEIYFSQQLINIDRVGKCYQEQDPTAEDLNALVATDGGVIPIPDCGVVLALEEGRNGIVVFATNGVWEISGVDGRFSADSFFVRKVTNTGCIASESVINADGTLLFWSDAGIIALGADKISDALNDENLTKNTIQTEYLQIGGVQRKFARGVYITEEKKAVWLYSTNSAFDGINNRYKYNGVLILDMQLGAFYRYTVSDLNADTAPYISDIIKVSPFKSESIVENVTELDGTIVTTSTGENVTINVEGFSSEASRSSWKILCVREQYAMPSMWGLTFGDFQSRSFTDWYLSDGIGADYSSYLETGFEIVQNPMVDKKPTYVNTFYSPKSKSLRPGYYEFPELPALSTFCGDVSTATFNGYANLSDSPWGVFVRETDGLKVIVYEGNNDRLLSYDLLTPYDITSWDAGSLVIASIPTAGPGAYGAFLSPDGTRCFTMETNVGPIKQYNMSTGWDLSTLTASGDTLTISSHVTNAYNLCFNNSGTKMYVVDGGSDKILQYDLSVAFEISSAVNNGKYLDITLSASYITQDIYVAPDNIRFYVLDENKIYVYYLLDPSDISTATGGDLMYTFVTQTGETGAGTTSFWFGNDGDVLYQNNDSNPNRTNQYNLECL